MAAAGTPGSLPARCHASAIVLQPVKRAGCHTAAAATTVAPTAAPAARCRGLARPRAAPRCPSLPLPLYPCRRQAWSGGQRQHDQRLLHRSHRRRLQGLCAHARRCAIFEYAPGTACHTAVCVGIGSAASQERQPHDAWPVHSPAALGAAPSPAPAPTDWQSDLASLCIAMPFMTSCTMWPECQVGSFLVHSPEPSSAPAARKGGSTDLYLGPGPLQRMPPRMLCCSPAPHPKHAWWPRRVAARRCHERAAHQKHRVALNGIVRTTPGAGAAEGG